MTENLKVKKDATRGLRSAMFPIGIIAAILGFVWFIIHTSGTTSTDAKFVDDMTKTARYVAMPFAFLTLVLAGLVITHGILQLVKLNKSNVKWELTSGIVNAIVGLLMFIFFIVIITKVFDEAKWFEVPYFSTWKIFSFMGILTALSVYSAVFGHQFNKKSLLNRNTNIKMLRTIAVFALVMSLCNIIAVSLTLAGGFIDNESASITEEQAMQFVTASYTAKYALAATGVIAFGILVMIPLAILGINDKAQAKKHIIMWSVVGGIAFILFVIGAGMMSLEDGVPSKWGDDHSAITVFVMLSEIASIVAGGMALGNTAKFTNKIAKA